MLLSCPALIIKKSGHSTVGNVHQLAKKILLALSHKPT